MKPISACAAIMARLAIKVSASEADLDGGVSADSGTDNGPYVILAVGLRPG